MEVDPDELLTWLKGDGSTDRDLQITALEQLCMLVLISDNIDRCFEQYQPRLFLPALCDIFSDPLAPTHVLEVTARALTYFLDVSVDCAKKITAHPTVIRSMCSSLQAVDMEDRTNKDLAEQIIKVFERLCSREASSIYEQNGLRCVLDFINNCYAGIHKDSLQSALNVVIKLIGKLDPQNCSTLDQTIESLSNLLLHDDTFVSDNALRCFATLADRFSRKEVDPEPLMRYCLKDVLLRSLHHVAKTSGNESTASAHPSPGRGVTTNISVVTGLLSTLCRASAKVTEDLLRSDLLDALESALCAGDERCVLDTMRFVDLLIGLLFEGRPNRTRSARPTAPATTTEASTTSSTASSSSSSAPEQYQQQIIELIRSRNVQEFKNFVEQNNIDVNYTDHVGQTMLNWVSAFGTTEMVEYLCRRGADVNRGQRSSSLHYAASFGRTSIIRILLKYGANIDLRDEDGRTPIDKARERQDDNQELLDILQSANEWMDTKQSINDLQSVVEYSQEEKEMQTIYFQRLLAIFCQLYQNTMILTIKRSTLRLISKLFQYATVEQIHQIKFLTTLFELLATILDTNEDDDDTSNLVLLIIKHLFEKDRHAFLEPFQYLGLISKITSLALSHQSNDADAEQSSMVIHILPIDANDILPQSLYLWKNFHLLRNRECLYLWTNMFIIELSMGSNGWFRFFANNSLSTMYSSGSPESNVDTDENRQDFIEKFQRLKQQVLDSSQKDRNDKKRHILIARTIFTSDVSSDRTITFGNWTFRCRGSGQLRIHNVEGEQATILEENLSGFIFESNRGVQQIHPAEIPLGEDFSVPWSTIETLRSSTDPSQKSTSVTVNKTKQEHMRQRTSEIALFIHDEYLKNVPTTNYTRPILLELKSIAQDLNNEYPYRSMDRLRKLFTKLKNFLLEQTTLSNYEFASSGLVDALLKIFQGLSNLTEANRDLVVQRAALFCSIFLSDDQAPAFHLLIRKLVSLLESIEKSPLYLYDSSLNCGLQIFSKRFRFQIQYQNEQQLFIDRTGKSLNMEPLATVQQLKNFLASMVSKQWFDYPHSHLDFVKLLKSNGRMNFVYQSDFDQNGILYWIGTNGKTVEDYTNPHLTGLVTVQCSEGSINAQQLANIISHKASGESSEESHRSYNTIVVDLGLYILPSHITLRCSGNANILTHWTKTINFHMSKDNFRFFPLETSLMHEGPSPVATWSIKNSFDPNANFRYLRITSKTTRHLVPLAGAEIYGHVFSAVDIRSKPELSRSRSARDEHRNRSNQTRSTPTLQHSFSTSASALRASKLQSHILHRFHHLHNQLSSSSSSSNAAQETRSAQSVIDRLLFDFHSIPNHLFNAMESEDSESLRAAISETISQLANQSSEGDDTPTPDVSDQATSNPFLLQVPIASSNASLRLSSSSEECFTDEASKGEKKMKSDSDASDHCSTSLFASANETERKSTSSASESVESLSAATEENNKKNTTNESTEQIFSTPSTMNIAEIPVIDSDTSLSDQQMKQQTEETSDDDEEVYLKLLQSNRSQIDTNMAEDEDEDEDEPERNEEHEDYNDEFQEQIHGQQQELTQRNWDDDFVLKRQFSVLLPAFDGRPGRTNINATQDIPVPSTMHPFETSTNKPMSKADALAAGNMTLFLCAPTPTPTGLEETKIEMSDASATIFKYVQELIRPFPSAHRLERIKRIFEPTYTIIYTEKNAENTKRKTHSSNLSCLANNPHDISKLEMILELLEHLHSFSTVYIEKNPFLHSLNIEHDFHSKKLNNKLLKQIEDSMIIASSSLPHWATWLTHSYRFFYPVESRVLFFRTTSFGTSRSIVLLQERREELLRTIRHGHHGARVRTVNETSSSSSSNAVQEFRFGRLKIDRATPIDREEILRDAMNLFHAHAKLKSKLEIQFLNEEGTGDGPTLEFYALVANELQKHHLGLWWNHDDEEHHSTGYVRKLEGLFPAPYPQDSSRLNDIAQYFSLIGIFFGKCLLDKYLIDMPLSLAFLKLLCAENSSGEEPDRWFDEILTLKDLSQIDPSRGAFFEKLAQLIEKRNEILNDPKKSSEEKVRLCQTLRIENEAHEPMKIEDLYLTFVYSPPSHSYGYQFVELIPNGSHIDVTIDNVDEYLRLSLQFILRDGIRRQMNAFRDGFNRVFSLTHLQCFHPEELKLVLCGNQWPSWTLEELLSYIDPSHGFTRDSPGFLKFLHVMMALDGFERKSVIQFITGCSSLPPGGLANLRPRLSVARKVEADDNSYPSVNTCYHYLKLPDYSSEEILKTRLMTACQERGFYFN